MLKETFPDVKFEISKNRHESHTCHFNSCLKALMMTSHYFIVKMSTTGDNILDKALSKVRMCIYIIYKYKFLDKF